MVEFTILQEPTETLKECKEPIKDLDWEKCPSIFNGKIYNIGYVPDNIDSKEFSINSEIQTDMDFAEELSKLLADVLEVSDSDCPYYPFILPSKISYLSNENFLQEFKSYMNISKTIAQKIGTGTGEFLIRDVTHSDSFFWDPEDILEDESVSDYFSQKEIDAYNSVQTKMKSNLSRILKISIGEGKFGRYFVCYPIFWIGQNKSGYWTGLFTIRVDT